MEKALAKIKKRERKAEKLPKLKILKNHYMNILVINAGSSSLKYQIINILSQQVLAKGLAERIGIEGGRIKHQYAKDEGFGEYILEENLPEHATAFEAITGLLTHQDFGVIENPESIKAIGHRVVHGGEKFTKTQIITPEVKEAIKSLIPLAPLHNPANLIGIEASEKFFPNAVQVAVFDTAFFATLPEHAYRYAIPKKFYTDNSIRVYGFHGTSHKFVYNEAKKILKNDHLKAITIHLGNGASMAAVNENGESIDTTLGFGPLCGLAMGTRSGDIDPSVIFYMVEELGFSLQEVKNILNKESGMLGLGGSSDARDINEKCEQGDADAKLTLELYTYRIKKYIGSYFAALNGVDTIIFTAGLGENDAVVRSWSCKNLETLGIKLDEEANVKFNHTKVPVEIQAPESKVKILIIPTNEELEIAQQTYELIQ